MGTLGRVCGDLGLRDARRGTWEGVDIKYGDTGTLMIIAKVRGQCNISFFMKMCYWMVNIRLYCPEPHWTPYDV